LYQLCISPCPNDTFIFYGIISGKIPLSFPLSTFYGDISELNHLASEGSCHFLKLSFSRFFQCKANYRLLRTGAALGFGCGPLLIARSPLTGKDLEEAVIGIPGEHTTANALLKLFYPKVENKKVVLFSDLCESLVAGDIDGALIIHETRFTYEDRGFVKIADLGELWEWETGLPVPLGGIFGRVDLDDECVAEMEQAILSSIQFAVDNPDATLAFCSKLAQEMHPDVLESHIELYVTDFSKSLGPNGEEAVAKLEYLCEHGLEEKD
jgi:1,4-dihydroxy-6-naphthoate synthase